MEAYQTMSWKELQDEYCKNMEKFDESINSLETTSNEIKKIYSQILEKSKEDSVETRKEFANLWLKNIDIENNSSFLEVKDDYDTFLNSSNPSVTDFENFEASLNQKLYRKPIHFLDSYGDSLKGFFDTCKYMWKNKP